MVQTCRNALRGVLQGPSHAGLLLARYLQAADDQGEQRKELLRLAIEAARRAKGIYTRAYQRWVEATRGAATMELQVRGRCVIGLGTDSVLETGLTLHHTYGTPMIPGSALKGLASHYCDRVWGRHQQEFRRWVEEQDSDGRTIRRPGTYFLELFGTTEDSGHIIFHDAWIVPDSLGGQNSGLVLDVLTPHHAKYYMAEAGDTKTPPTDFDSPNPVLFLSVSGRFRFAVDCDVPDSQGQQWAELALKLLKQALESWGVGAKTASGYGRFSE